MEARAAALEGAYRQVADRLNGIDTRLNSIDARLDRMDERLSAGITNLGETLRAKMDRQFYWIIGIIAVSGVAVIGVVIAAMQAIVSVARSL